MHRVFGVYSDIENPGESREASLRGLLLSFIILHGLTIDLHIIVIWNVEKNDLQMMKRIKLEQKIKWFSNETLRNYYFAL